MMSISGYGEEYEIVIGRSKAAHYLGELNAGELPRMGYEVILKKERSDFFGVWAYLSLQNISGTFVLASPTHMARDWEQVFGIELPAKKHRHDDLGEVDVAGSKMGVGI